MKEILQTLNNKRGSNFQKKITEPNRLSVHCSAISYAELKV